MAIFAFLVRSISATIELSTLGNQPRYILNTRHYQSLHVAHFCSPASGGDPNSVNILTNTTQSYSKRHSQLVLFMLYYCRLEHIFRTKHYACGKGDALQAGEPHLVNWFYTSLGMIYYQRPRDSNASHKEIYENSEQIYNTSSGETLQQYKLPSATQFALSLAEWYFLWRNRL